VARDAVATRRGFGSPQATSQKREVAHPTIEIANPKASADLLGALKNPTRP
jgi:hypothetical protein